MSCEHSYADVLRSIQFNIYSHASRCVSSRANILLVNAARANSNRVYHVIFLVQHVCLLTFISEENEAKWSQQLYEKLSQQEIMIHPGWNWKAADLIVDEIKTDQTNFSLVANKK